MRVEGLPIYGFMHVARMNNWEEIVADQFQKISQTGLGQATARITLGVVGTGAPVQIPGELQDKTSVGFEGDNLALHEYPTLAMLENVCGREDCLAWYIHTKGASRNRPGERESARNWRHYMEWFVLENWEACIRALKDANCVGSMWNGWTFLGNFWWTRADYVRQLTYKVRDSHWGNRGEAETWLFRSQRRLVRDLGDGTTAVRLRPNYPPVNV